MKIKFEKAINSLIPCPSHPIPCEFNPSLLLAFPVPRGKHEVYSFKGLIVSVSYGSQHHSRGDNMVSKIHGKEFCHYADSNEYT